MKKVLFQPSLIGLALLLNAAALLAQNAQNATLVVRADAECKLSVDGEAKGVLRPDDRMRIVLQLGEHLVEAVPTAGGKRWEQVVNLNEAKTQVLTITLPKAPAPPPAPAKTTTTTAPAPPKPYFSDFQTLLMWATKDNGQDVNWVQANAYCKSLTIADHTDWRLPRVQELATIQGSGAPRASIKSTGIAWTGFKGELPGTALAYSFSTGKDFSAPTQTSQYYRALCVRGGK